MAVNRINNLLSGDFYGLAPQVGSDTGAAGVIFAASGPFAGGASNPLNYPVESITLGNGISCLSEKSGFGSPCGGFSDTRMQAYAGDTLKLRPNLTLTIGVQYVRDTGRTDSDLAPIPCSAVAASYGTQAPCSGSDDLLSHFGGLSGLGGQVRQPDMNFAPQFGLAWDPGKSGRTVVRAGIGMYYDNNVFRNLVADRAARVANGQFNAQANDPCASHGVVIFPGNLPTSAAGLCGQAIGNVATAITDLQTAYQAATAALSSGSPNPSYLGQALNSQQGLLASNYQTPRSVQMNIGFQKQILQTTLFSVDYVRNVGTHYLIGYDTNHVGDAALLNTKAALNAINNTLAANTSELGLRAGDERRWQFAECGELLPRRRTGRQYCRLCQPRPGFRRSVSWRRSRFFVWSDSEYRCGICRTQSFGGTQYHVLSRGPLALQWNTSSHCALTSPIRCGE